MSTPPLPPSSDAQAGPDPDLLAALSASTPPLELQRIAAERPDLHALLAANPATYPELLEWLRASEDPAVLASLVNRAPAQPTAAPAAAAPTAPAEAPAPLPPAEPTAGSAPVAGSAPTVVVVVVLAAAGLGVRALLGRGGAPSSATATVQEVSAGWAEGSHKLWKLDVDEEAVIDVNGDQMVVGTRNSSYELTRVTAYDVSGSEPEEQWEMRVDQEYGYVRYWGNWVHLGGSQLLRASDGTLAEAGWDEDDFPTLIGAYALTCDEHDHCAGWSASDPTAPLWEQDITGSVYWMEAAYHGWAVHDGSLVTLAARDTVVRLEDGALTDLKINDEESVIPLTDGWLVVNYVDEEYRVLSPSGEQVDSFEGAWPGYDEETYLRLFESPRPTAAQMRALVVDGDLSWATVTSRNDPDEKDDCSLTLTIGERALVPAREDGQCVYGTESSWYALSSDGSLLMHVEGSPAQTSVSVSLSGMWSVADGEPVAFAGSDPGEQLMWLVDPGLVITFDREDGQVTAYAPGKK
ncbi:MULTISPECIES: hypothetical protein [unclassified Actinomyces]|uniref:variant leucine-rich repeat-containing protein n=1 Tax=unclassified Actinomyces TaxID=2609248 RepID=UPI0020178E09|nr:MULTISPECIES: hypothetical protein [unclassified Actinomyces]MCL3795316.1 hypothetical protein [Actinomyces sp. 217892]